MVVLTTVCAAELEVLSTLDLACWMPTPTATTARIASTTSTSGPFDCFGESRGPVSTGATNAGTVPARPPAAPGSRGPPGGGPPAGAKPAGGAGGVTGAGASPPSAGGAGWSVPQEGQTDRPAASAAPQR